MKETIFKILTLGLYALFSKGRKVKQSTQKVKYRDDGSVKKSIKRDTEYDCTSVDFENEVEV